MRLALLAHAPAILVAPQTHGPRTAINSDIYFRVLSIENEVGGSLNLFLR